MSTPRKKKTVNAAPSQGRKGHQLPARAPLPLWEAILSLAKAERRSSAQVILFLLEEALEARGLWPPPADASPSDSDE
ncbi:MAG TPA: hypothetical protein VMG10_10680 [Gemmataceae bacterium]|nr:hypothetical protein [Gemmataceae bacterium]